MTQTEIAKRVGIPQARVCRWESGKVPAAADDAIKLQQLLNEIDAGGDPCGQTSGVVE